MPDTLTGDLVGELAAAEVGNPVFDELAAALGDPFTSSDVWVLPEEVEQS